MKDWNAIARDLSSGEDSDADDSLNVLQVQKNARRVAELMHTFVPALAAEHLARGATPLGMNRPDLIRTELASTIARARAAAAEQDAPAPPADGAPAPQPNGAPAPRANAQDASGTGPA